MCVVNIPDVYIYISTSPKQVSTRYFTGKKRGRALMSSQSLFVDLQHHGSPPARCVETVDPSCRKISKHNPQKKRAQLESLDLQEKHKRWKYYIFGAPKIWCFSFFFKVVGKINRFRRFKQELLKPESSFFLSPQKKPSINRQRLW